jgi:uncharacterized protein YndB with AHSA1/START domain
MSTFKTSRIFNATPESMFSALQDPARLARWWGPAGFRNTFELCDVRSGGAWRFTMHGPDGANYPNVSTFVAVEAPHKVVIQHENAPRFVLTITLSSDAAGTRVDWVQTFEDAAVAAAVRHIVEPANEQNLDRWMAEVGGHASESP